MMIVTWLKQSIGKAAASSAEHARMGRRYGEVEKVAGGERSRGLAKRALHAPSHNDPMADTPIWAVEVFGPSWLRKLQQIYRTAPVHK